ncbi:MAG: hypothetical protein QM749_16345 [Aquabacterium sp.]
MNIISESRVIEGHWMYCLSEACYGIAASFELAHWLMSQWHTVVFDFEPVYDIWKSGGTYEVIGDTCMYSEVFQTNEHRRRSDSLLAYPHARSPSDRSRQPSG